MRQITKTTKAISINDISRQWHLIDAKGQILGRIATQAASFLQGKNKKNYVSYLDSGDNVVIINVDKVVLTGNKKQDKIYSYYSGYPGGLRQKTAGEYLEKNPAKLVSSAVSGMLPKNKLRDRRLLRLFVYSGDKHPYLNKFDKK